MAKEKRIAVIDAETDPFLFGREPEPFAWGFYDGVRYAEFWGDDCTAQLIAFLATIDEPLLIYAHNGGKFDFFFLLEYLGNPLRIINGRIVAAGIGIHELRDSYAIIPVPLSAWSKEEIEYAWFERDKREKYRKEILHYLASDCENLFAIVSEFVNRFGTKLTVGSTAMKELRKFHEIERTDKSHDEQFRPFYYGGRVECLKRGELRGDWKIFDVNSMYPHVMRDYFHPKGKDYATLSNAEIDKRGELVGFPNVTYFAEIVAYSNGALPVRTNEGIAFPIGTGTFLACAHEIRVAMKHGLLIIDKVLRAHVPLNHCQFSLYVDHFMAEKIAAKEKGDRAAELFAKFMLNSAYGKFGTNPENFFDYLILRRGEFPPEDDFEIELIYSHCTIWRRATPSPNYFDVAIASSITSASRAVLLDAFKRAENPVYMDTDSLICEGLDLPLSKTALGAWKIEATGDRLYLAGKKMYALYSGKEPVKMASKGARLKPADIAKIAKGAVIRWQNDAPSFSLTRGTNFVDRDIRST